MQDTGPKQRVLTDVEAVSRASGFINGVNYVLDIKVRCFSIVCCVQMLLRHFFPPSSSSYFLLLLPDPSPTPISIFNTKRVQLL